MASRSLIGSQSVDLGRGGHAACFAVVAHALLMWALRPGAAGDELRSALMLVLSAAFLALCLTSARAAARIGVYPYITLLNALALAVVWASDGSALLVPHASLAMLVPVARRRFVALTALLHTCWLALVLSTVAPTPMLVIMVSAFASGVVFVVAFTEIAVRERTARAELSVAHEQLAASAAQAEALATLEERNRIGRELHDSLGHYLTVIHVHLEAAASHLQLDPLRAADAIEKAGRLTREGLTDVRRSVRALRGAALESGGLGAAMESLAAETTAAGIKTSFTQRGDERVLSPTVELVLYRGTQEGLTNVLKHSGAASACVELAWRDTEVHLTIQDEGRGAPTGYVPGFGLRGLRERAEQVGGQLVLSGDPGFCVTLTVPG